MRRNMVVRSMIECFDMKTKEGRCTSPRLPRGETSRDGDLKGRNTEGVSYRFVTGGWNEWFSSGD